MTHKQSGFSLIEIMIALAIIGLIAAVGVPNFIAYQKRAAKQTTHSTLRTLKTVIEQYKIDVREYPKTLQDLVRPPKDEDQRKRWLEGGYIGGSEIPEDAWGNPFKYSQKQDKNNPFTLYSYGPNGPGSPKGEWLSAWDKV